ncbi:hypothetical protein ABEG10_38270 (plasmid) [Burkholderia cenocepacia]|uniref:hypothetical protein n=1 Tax=Burkholderia cenocepacia TaxID=95486 RepID=UPI0020A032DD|nr:hypothetical protein [Burkholderia cenocepacia]MCO8402766.1 hypothetical protein [Burkholderia cenocepacia]MCO8415102.1 hypothetical protein [Burkholderia cenocepacia]MCO8423099.1 hypothetical protein [Burkholderia cenocepacia]MCO8474752.1 hypothetical protein [Burkholderia cenocepacia]MCO8482068.1 hypothetical protein [Burkholderia cenocepacia]
MRKLILMLALATVATVAEADDAGRYIMLDSEASMDVAIARWAEQDGRSAKWEAHDYIDVGNPSALNRKARLAEATTIGDATARLLKQAPDKPRLFACVYSQGPVAVVIRQAGQPGCDKHS